MNDSTIVATAVVAGVAWTLGVASLLGAWWCVQAWRPRGVGFWRDQHRELLDAYASTAEQARIAASQRDRVLGELAALRRDNDRLLGLHSTGEPATVSLRPLAGGTDRERERDR